MPKHYTLKEAADYINERLPDNLKWTSPLRSVENALYTERLTLSEASEKGKRIFDETELDRFIEDKLNAPQPTGGNPRIEFTEDVLAMFEFYSDKVIAGAANCSQTTVFRYRQDNEILSSVEAARKRTLEYFEGKTAEDLDLPNYKIAQELRVNRSLIKKVREELGI